MFKLEVTFLSPQVSCLRWLENPALRAWGDFFPLFSTGAQTVGIFTLIKRILSCLLPTRISSGESHIQSCERQPHQLQNPSELIADSPWYLLGTLYAVRKAHFILDCIKQAVPLKTDVGLLCSQCNYLSPFLLPAWKFLSCERDAVTDLPSLHPFTSTIK